jgi:hypothetical protein
MACDAQEKMKSSTEFGVLIAKYSIKDETPQNVANILVAHYKIGRKA